LIVNSALETYFRHGIWSIGIIPEPITVFLRPDARPRVRWLQRVNMDKYLADPFATIRDGRIHILCEEFDFRTSKGRIVTIELTKDLLSLGPKVVMGLPVHASYPYLFEYRGAIYCTPETYQTGEVGLYKAKTFPYEWEKVATIVENFPGVDNTVFEHEGKWWLTSAHVRARPHYKLFVWHAPDPLGPWVPHAVNPVKTDIGSSRPAGTPFVFNGHLYRPTQDCSRTYGGRIVINRVLTLTSSKFEEEPASYIEPYSTGPYPHGVHTISSVAEITIIDGKRHVFNKQAFRAEMMSLVRNRLHQNG
jgi:hypothetical protein